MKYSNTLFWYEKNLKRGEMQTPAADILQVAELAVAVGSEITEHIQNCDEIFAAGKHIGEFRFHDLCTASGV